jgi:hypothetical protein
MTEPQWAAKIYPVRIRFDLKQFFLDESLTKKYVEHVLEAQLARAWGVTIEVGEPEYEAA